MRAHTIVLLCCVLSAACDDTVEPPGPADFEGTWLITSITFADPPSTLYRIGGDENIRGDAVFAVAGDASGTLSVRQVVLHSGLIASEVMTPLLAVSVETDRWVLTDPVGEVTVFGTALDGDHLVLTTDATDPRHTAVDAPVSVVVDRAVPWSKTSVGEWELVSMRLPDTTVTGGACTELEPGEAWGTITMEIEFTPRLLFAREMTLTRYSDALCTTPTGTSSSTQMGYAEEELGTRLRIWGVENGVAEFQDFSLSLVGDVATLTRTSCLPMPACETEAPLEVVVRRVP